MRHPSNSEHELSTQFQGPRIPCTGDLSELTVAVRCVQRVRLEVVERVERLEAELKPRCLSDLERFVQRSREI